MKEIIDMCEVIQDLLPLYEDGCCSVQSAKLVEEHLKTCDVCQEQRAAYEKYVPGTEADEEEDVRGIRQGIRLLVRWRTIGRIVLGLMLTVVFVIIPIWNQVRGMGLTYANLGAVCTAYAFERAVASGDYEKAYNYLDMEFRYEELVATELVENPDDQNSRKNTEAITAGIHEVEEKGFSWYNRVCRDAFLRNMKILEEKNEGIRSWANLQVEKQPFGWRVCLNARTDAGTKLIMQMDISGNRIRGFSAYADHQVSQGISGAQEELAAEGKMYEVLYQTPSINETVMEILYGNTDYDWRGLFEY